MRSIALVLIGMSLMACGGRTIAIDDGPEHVAPPQDPTKPVLVKAPVGQPPTRPGQPLEPYDQPEPPARGEPAFTSCLGIHDCATNEGYAVSTYAAPTRDGLEVLALGVYETRSDHSATYRPVGSATVKDTRSTPHVLVLSSYEPTVWEVIGLPGSALTKVVLVGYNAQQAKVPPGVVVEDHSGASPACAYAYPDNGQGCDTAGLLRFSEKVIGEKVVGFAGCYRATKFTVTDGACR